jgi:hypothetical protein
LPEPNVVRWSDDNGPLEPRVGKVTQQSDLQQSIRDFVTSFESCVPAIVDDIERRQLSEVPEIPESLDQDLVRDAAAVGVAVALSAMRVSSETSTIAPDASLREARGLAAAGGSLATLLHSYRAGHAVIQEHMLMHAAEVGTPMVAVRTMSDRLFIHIDRLMQLSTQEFMQERRRRNGNVDLMLYTRVSRLLKGEPEDLPYPSEGHHIAVVFDADATPNAPELVSENLGLPALRVPTPTREIWLWLNVPSDVVASDVHGVLEAFMSSGAAGVSDRASGASGIAISHRQAQLACRLGSLRGIRVSSYNEIALEALAFGGRDAARDFAQAELGLLGDDGQRTELLRQTVQTYFAKGSSAAAAAESLGVAERTVTYRLRRAEELVGKPLSSRRAEIEAALRLHRVLDQVG